MGQSTIFVGQPLLVAAIFLIAYLYGRRLTLSVPYRCTLERLAFSVTLGVGVIAYLVFFLGLFHLLYWHVAAVVLLIGAVLCYPVWRTWPGEASRWMVIPIDFPGTGKATAIGAVVILALMPAVLLAFYPPTAFDATLYHLAAAKTYVEHHALIFTPYLRFPVFPQHNQMLFALALLLGNDIGAQLITFALMLTLAAAIIAFGRRHFSTRAGIWAAALFIGNPLILWLGASCYVDICLILNITLAVYGLYNWITTEERSWLILSATFCGFAVVTKYPGLVFLFLLTAAVLYAGLKKRKPGLVLLFVSAAVIAMAPWLIRNCYYTGNPIFPFFNKPIGALFGYRLWKPEYLEGLYESGFNGFNGIGVGRTLSTLVKLPYYLAFEQRKFWGPADLSPAYLFLLPFLIYGAMKSVKVRWLVTLVLAFTVYWFYSIQDIRYLLPALPILTLAMAVSIDRLLDFVPLLRKRLVFMSVTVAVSVVCVAQGWLYSQSELERMGTIPVTQQARDAYLSRIFPAYPAYMLLNQSAGHNYTLFAMYTQTLTYFADGLVMGDYWGPARYPLVLPKIKDSAALYEQLRAFGADYFLLSNETNLTLPSDQFFQQHFRLLYHQDKVSLYQLTM